MTGSRNNPWRRLLMYGFEYIGMFYSSYRGYVINNNDPDNMGRLQLVVPSVDGQNADPTWVPSKAIWGGKDYGVHIIPNIGDVVWVEYAFGKANRPMWSHYGWSKDQKPEEFSHANVYGFKSPEGHVVTIDDKLGKINITSKSGKRISILDDGGIIIDATEMGNIEISSGKSNIALTEQGVFIDVGDQELLLNGSQRVLYAVNEAATKIQNFADIGISESTKVGL